MMYIHLPGLEYEGLKLTKVVTGKYFCFGIITHKVCDELCDAMGEFKDSFE